MPMNTKIPNIGCSWPNLYNIGVVAIILACSKVRL